MFVTVYFGQDQSMLCNTSCKVMYLMMHLRKATGLTKQTNVDLCDEAGKVMALERFAEEDADKVLSDRTAYILLEKRLLPAKSEDTENQVRYSYIPLLANIKEKYPHLSNPLTIKHEKSKRNNKSAAQPAPTSGEQTSKSRKASAKVKTED